MHELIQFEWDVNLDGYELICFPRDFATKAGRSIKATPFLVERIGSRKGFRRYPVLPTRTGLFRDFARLKKTPADVLSFAGENGRLGGELVELIPDDRMVGEPLLSWYAEIGEMRRLTQLWDLARNERKEGLSRLIHWGKNGVFYLDTGPDRIRAPKPSDMRQGAIIASQDLNPEVLKTFAQGDVIRPACCFLRTRINEKLRQYHASPSLLWEVPNRGNQMRFCLQPQSLIAAIWVQFADAVARHPKFRECQECQKWFELVLGKRSDSKYCSDACKSRAYRRRHDR